MIPKKARCPLSQGQRQGAASAGLTLLPLLLLALVNNQSSVHFLLQQNEQGAGNGTEEG